MVPNFHTVTFKLPDGRDISIETGKLAKQADGAAVVKMGDTMLLATVVSQQEGKEDVDFLPLTCEYQEKYAATGRFPGGFIKRETKPSEYEILIARLVDRALRPLFYDDYHAETQVLITLISGDKNTLPDALACLAASAAITVSDIPWNGPVSEVRVGRINGEFVINPSVADLNNSDMDIIVAATKDNIIMVEGEMDEISEDDLLEALKYAHETIKIQCEAQLELMAKAGKPKREYCHETNDEELKKRLYDFAMPLVCEVAAAAIPCKKERRRRLNEIKEKFLETCTEEEKQTKLPMINRYYSQVEWEGIRKVLFETGIRLDGRKPDEIRPIWCEVNYLPAAHGSAIFTRGETQSLTTVTLGTKLDEQTIDGAVLEGKSNFLLHYNFPPFSTGEVKPIRGTSRREIGHGNLALRALKRMIPPEEENPYTIRVVSDILESNGSSSMATVCAGTLALMDAGVKIKKPVSGIAMGLITDDNGNYIVLSDILGDEDHIGDMDFKVTGTRDGITACQMDIKVKGLSYEILRDALEQAKKGRLYILDKLVETMPEPRPDYKPHVPRIIKMTIPKEFIGAVIGPAGKIIQDIQKETGTTIVIEEVGDVGVVDIVASNAEASRKVINKIKILTGQLQTGDILEGVVKSIAPFGAFIEICPGKEGLLHISEIDWKRLTSVESVLKPGDKVKVKLIDIDKRTGRLKFSRKALIPKPF